MKSIAQSIAKLDAAMAEQRYLGGLDRLAALTPTWTGAERPAAHAALAAATALAPLLESRPIVDQVELLRGFLDRHDRDHNDRRRRVRAAVTNALDGLAAAYRRHDPSAAGTVTELSAAIRRWLGSQTFAAAAGQGGLRILDAQAARFADLDDVQIMGLVEGEWPERPRRNVFYPRGTDRAARTGAAGEGDGERRARSGAVGAGGVSRSRRSRAASHACLHLLARGRIRRRTLIVHRGPAVVRAAIRNRCARDADAPAFEYEVLAHDPASSGSRWAAIRAANGQRDRRRFEGEAGAWVLPRVSVSRLERYMKCPFQFYVANVLQVAEEPEDETSRSPLERGRFLHELFETFFHEWQSRGRGRITAADMNEARALFEDVAGPALRSLSPSEAGLERARLFGSAVGSGIVDRVFAMEAERGVEIRERLMEYQLDGTFQFHRRRRRGPRGPPPRQDRSRRSAPRRHVPADRLQDQVRAGSQAGAAAADLQRVRPHLAHGRAGPRHSGERGDVSVVRRAAGGRAARRTRQDVRRVDGVCRSSAGRGARCDRRRPLPVAAGDQEPLHDVRLCRGVQKSGRGRRRSQGHRKHRRLRGARATEGTEGSEGNV